MKKERTVKIKDLSTVSMVARGDKLPGHKGVNEVSTRVIHDGILKNWVGFGWVDERRATRADKQRYAVAI